MERQSHAVLAQLLHQGHFVNNFLYILSTNPAQQQDLRLSWEHEFLAVLGIFPPISCSFWKKFRGFPFPAPVFPTKTWLGICQC